MQEAKCFGAIYKVHAVDLVSGACSRQSPGCYGPPDNSFLGRHVPVITHPPLFPKVPPPADHEGAEGQTPVASLLLLAVPLARHIHHRWLQLPSLWSSDDELGPAQWPPPPRPAAHGSKQQGTSSQLPPAGCDPLGLSFSHGERAWLTAGEAAGS